MIQVQLPDGSIVESPDRASAMDVAKGIGARLAAAVVAAEVDGAVAVVVRDGRGGRSEVGRDRVAGGRVRVVEAAGSAGFSAVSALSGAATGIPAALAASATGPGAGVGHPPGGDGQPEGLR